MVELDVLSISHFLLSTISAQKSSHVTLMSHRARKLFKRTQYLSFVASSVRFKTYNSVYICSFIVGQKFSRRELIVALSLG